MSLLGKVVPTASAVAGTAPGLARVAAGAAWHTAGWGLRTSSRAGFRVARAVVDQDVRDGLVRETAEAVGIVAGTAARIIRSGSSPAMELSVSDYETAGHDVVLARTRETETSEDSLPVLRRRGADLLDRSRDVWADEQGHPAYARILDELAPDEARMLLYLLQAGPQPSVDIRTGGPSGLVGSTMIAPGLNMIAGRSGVRYPERVPAYLNNLFRLGLVWFSKEPLPDPLEYQVLEAQPDVLDALRSVKFAKIVRRSVHLTPFGEAFGRTTLVDEGSAESAYPEHQAPVTGGADLPKA
ncbi:Abi-alpha family protein [Nocardioides sp.]|uniref:Abi-alpha family protein n=1 Tax=Nocardioides sp. TaxID=35761 RepID=UPI0025E9BA14|nr:Abi-alpha family protein [Nocardioides sp.]